MKRHILTLVSISVMLLGTSCHKESSIPEEKPQGPLEVTITGEMGEFSPTAKSSAEPCLRMKWTTGDVVWAYGTTDGTTISGLGKLSVTVQGGNDYIAVMSGTLSSAPEDGKLYLAHSSLLDKTTQPSLTGGILSVNMADQTASATPFVAYATVENVTATGQTELKAKFNFATSVLKMNATGLVSGQALTSATLSGVETECRLTITTSGFTIGSGTSGTVTKALSGTVPGTSRASFYVSVPKISEAAGRSLTVASGGKKYHDYGVVSQAQAENKYVSCVCEVKTLNYVDEYGVDRGDGTYIDSTGVVWAPVNCGYHPVNFKWGKLYQWGRKYGRGYVLSPPEDTTYNDAGGIVQEDAYSQVDGSTVIEEATKYYIGKGGYGGYMDWLKTPNVNRWDAVTGNPFDTTKVVPVKTPMDPCPPGWRVPTYYELKALIGGKMFIPITLQTYNEQKGHWFDGTAEAPENSGIFLPAAGYCGSDMYEPWWERNEGGYYWSSTAVAVPPGYETATFSKCLFFYANAGLYQYFRINAFSVRCVQE